MPLNGPPFHYAREYQVDEVLLFGSSLDPTQTAHDVDLAVKGIEPARFFRFTAGRPCGFVPQVAVQ